MSDIVETIEECNRYARNTGDLLSIKGFLYPHNIVTFAAYLKSNQIKKENVKISVLDGWHLFCPKERRPGRQGPSLGRDRKTINL